METPDTFVVQAEADTLNEATGQPSGDRWEVDAASAEEATAKVRTELDADPERAKWRIVYAVPKLTWEEWQRA